MIRRLGRMGLFLIFIKLFLNFYIMALADAGSSPARRPIVSRRLAGAPFLGRPCPAQRRLDLDHMDSNTMDEGAKSR
jgi:hypothetical protein